jgi:hypothetical protein
VATALPPSSVRDLSLREVMALAPLIVFMFWIGVHPNFFTSRMSASLDPLALSTSERFEEFYRSGPVAPVAGVPTEPAPSAEARNHSGLPSPVSPAEPFAAAPSAEAPPLGRLRPHDSGPAAALAEEVAHVD